MSTLDVTLIDPALSSEHKRELEASLTRALRALPGARLGHQQWRVVVRPVRSAAPNGGVTTQPAAASSVPRVYADWHARLAGTGNRAPGAADSAIG